MSRYRLSLADGRYYLSDSFSSQKPLSLSFSTSKFLRRIKAASKTSELIARAVGTRHGLKVIDCTAGLGREGFLLAYLGCDVTLIERSRVIHTLLRDALNSASYDPDLKRVVNRISLHQSDSRDFLSQHPSWDVIYIDSMFPEKKKTSLPKGDMQYLQRFLSNETNDESLLKRAFRCNFKRLVVKRPLKTGFDEIRKADLRIQNDRIRFDIYLGI